MKLINESKSKTVYHGTADGVVEIKPGQLVDVDDRVAGEIMSAWKEVRSDGGAAVNLPKQTWEEKCGPTWEKAKEEFRIDLGGRKKRVTVGADTPEVVEPPVPADAIDTETGAVSEKKLNMHGCTYCGADFNKITALRGHMKRDHGV